MLEDRIRLGNLTDDEYNELSELIKQADAYTAEVNALADVDKTPEKLNRLKKVRKQVRLKRPN